MATHILTDTHLRIHSNRFLYSLYIYLAGNPNGLCYVESLELEVVLYLYIGQRDGGTQ